MIADPDLNPRIASDAAWARQRPKPDRDDRPNGKVPDDLDPIDPSMFAGEPVPERQWLVADWIPMARVTAIYGAGGEGKTLLAQMLATACAIGAPWLDLPARRCHSLLLFCEDDADEMRRRQAAINEHFGCDFNALGAIRWLPRLGEDNALMRWSDGRSMPTPLLDRIIATAKAHDAKLIVTDTLADVFAGNENDRSQARAFAQSALGFLARETGGAVIALAHPSRAGMNSGSSESGSTAWIGTFRSQLYLSTPQPEDGAQAQDDLRILARRKSNAARRNETVELRWRNGVFIPARPTGLIGSIERRTCDRVFGDLLDRLTSDGRSVSHHPRAGNYAPKIFAAQPDAEGFRKADFAAAMERLFAAKEITIGSHTDRYRRQQECLVRAKSPVAHGAHGHG